VIRRLFWLLAGAGLGISGYRRVTRVFRGFARPGLRRRPRREHGLAGFARDVREGMDLYAERQRLNTERRHAPAGPTLGSHQVTAARAGLRDRPAGRNGSAAPRAHR
jgi:hypothetical protein